MPYHNVTGKEAFAFYRKKSRHRKIENTPSIKSHTRIINIFWTKVAEKLLEKKGGVFIDSMGYFCIGLVPHKFLLEKKEKNHLYLNSHTNSRVYFPLFIPNPRNYTLTSMLMDRNFEIRFKQKLSRKIKKGMKYMNYYETISKTFLHKKKYFE